MTDRKYLPGTLTDLGGVEHGGGRVVSARFVGMSGELSISSGPPAKVGEFYMLRVLGHPRCKVKIVRVDHRGPLVPSTEHYDGDWSAEYLFQIVD